MPVSRMASSKRRPIGAAHSKTGRSRSPAPRQTVDVSRSTSVALSTVNGKENGNLLQPSSVQPATPSRQASSEQGARATYQTLAILSVKKLAAPSTWSAAGLPVTIATLQATGVAILDLSTVSAQRSRSVDAYREV